MSHVEEIFRRNKGFTLMELMVSIGILSIVMICLFFIFNTSLMAFQRINDELLVLRNARHASMWLSSNIKRSKEVEIISPSKIYVKMYHEDDNLTFSFKNGVLYREKNGGSNPIVELASLKFSRVPGYDCILVELSCTKNHSSFSICHRVTPMGSVIGKTQE